MHVASEQAGYECGLSRQNYAVIGIGTSEMALWGMNLAAKPGEMTSSPAAYLVEGADWFSPVVLNPLCTCFGSVTPPTHKRNRIRRTEFQRFSIKNRM